MATIISNEQMLLYFNGHKVHKCYKDQKDLYDALRIHADGVVPEKLIKCRRPSESEETFIYREKIYVPKTKNPIGKVISSLSKIRRSPDWNVKYDEKKSPSRIIDGERLWDYCETNYPEHGSVTNWMFSHQLKTQCIDANAVIAVFPMNLDAAALNEYYKPIAMIFTSDKVLYFEDGGDLAILKSDEKSDLISDDGTIIYQAGRVFYVISITEFERWDEGKTGEFTRTRYLLHGKKKLPVFRIKAQFLKQKESVTIQESRISPMLPSLDEAAREYSDLQAAKVQHMFPLFWYYSSKECGTCNGTGKVIDMSTEVHCSVDCKVCGGKGKIKFSPYVHLEVEPPKMGETTLPMPPAGYVARDVEIIKVQDESVKAHLFDSLASINMQFMDQEPLNISGKAKGVDREELNNFVYSFAEDLVFTMDKIYWWINEWRNAVSVSDYKARQELLPAIAVPENFDLLPEDYLMDEISKAKTAKVNPLLIAEMELAYACKKFYSNPDVANQIQTIYDLDPLPGLAVDEKMSLLTNKGCTQEDYVISAYISPFVKRAFAEDDDLMSKTLDQKRALMEKYAAEKIKVNDAADKIKQDQLQQQQQAASFNPAAPGNPAQPNKPAAAA